MLTDSDLAAIRTRYNDTTSTLADISALLEEVAILRELMDDREQDLQYEYDRANQAEKQVETLREKVAILRENMRLLVRHLRKQTADLSILHAEAKGKSEWASSLLLLPDSEYDYA